MSDFISSQLDFIFFFYGLAFLLLGIVSLAMSKGFDLYTLVGVFGILHGSNEWLDLIALIGGDSAAFKTARTVLLVASFMVLLEAVRMDVRQRVNRCPGPWIHLVVLLPVILIWWENGGNDANAMARYCFALTGAIGVTALMLMRCRQLSGAERIWSLLIALGFALYGIAAGVIVPAASFWPATVINQAEFARVSGLPIQLIRGVLACWITFATWGFWKQQAAREVASARYTEAIKSQVRLTFGAAVAILIGGWALTEHLGTIYRENVEVEANGYFNLLSEQLAAQTAAADRVAELLAETPSVAVSLAAAAPNAMAEAALRRHVEAALAQRGYILTSAGTVLAATDRSQIGRPLDASIVRLDIPNRSRGDFVADRSPEAIAYLARFPVRSAGGEAVGSVVLQVPIRVIWPHLSELDRAAMLVDPNGVVALSNRPGLIQRKMWPALAPLGRGQAAADAGTALNGRLAHGAWVSLDGVIDYAQRKPIGGSGWSFVVMSAPLGIVASRLLGILITLLVTAVTLTYLVGRGRWAYNEIQLDRRLELEDLARTLDLRASTDALTGSYNRFKFNAELSVQIARARRYGVPLALVLYDVDRFKTINDTYGHPAGDEVLRRLSEITELRIRSTDTHARWGGEEFVILTPDSTAAMAHLLAELLRGTIEHAGFGEVGQITCSFGVTEFAKDDTEQSFLARADHALYRAKRLGRNRVEVAEPTPRQAPDIRVVGG
ncbi:diguanylate cyclase (GGDEF)-like protein [Rhodopseudomonas rhenobacensis]|uniref:diguanylate cyclase n=1 Tax=Rhodopseudomonas rhenobacensis TaxID=87461 RepID=A0A7W7Z759_9BRAD|nr:sensor domain-containing diguanylate cyclase [Rhodopseudomonas rhenobacensis]MBB5049286.1 diguanylate cyclase (GGDEF)-like protein [Rhodopseudomonas rhenobacensis]